MLTKKIKRNILENPSSGFLSWFSDSIFEQREVGPFLSIGRDPSQMIALDDPFASRRHARIENQDDKGEFILKDMNSRNGTFLNGNKIFKAILKNNDCVKIGKTEFVFSFKRFSKNWKLFHKSLNLNWNKQLSRLPSMAQTEFPILIIGPSGTGKEHLAQMIHSHSNRSLGPYVSVNCSALTETLTESEFFGHIKGSYTGADQDRKGAFLSAHRGTLFLDEIGDLPLHLQPKLLRALEMKEIKPVGSDQTIKVDVRIVAATHQDLKKKVFEKTFREDLYFRIRVLEINPPSLKNRMEDFDTLFSSFSEGLCFSKIAIQCLKNHPWSGNIRELKNTVARAKAMFQGEVIDEDKVMEILDPLYTKDQTAKDIPFLKKMEKEMLVRVLKENEGNQTKAALQLGIARSTFSYRLRQCGVHLHNQNIKEL